LVSALALALAAPGASAASAGSPAASASSCTPPYCPSHRLKVNKGGNGEGTVTSSPAGINCGATCQADYEEGTTVTLAASAAPGSTFTKWTGAGCSGTGACVVTIERNTTVTAVFHEHPPNPPHPRVYVKPKHNGTVHCSVFLPEPGKTKIWGPSIQAVYIHARSRGKFKVALSPKGRAKQHLRNRGWTRKKQIFVLYRQGSSRTKVKRTVRFRQEGP
jgi:hypothetical protein